ncbi:MAG: ABC transporter permease, partial [Paracoccaceae bacterium]|nr:ABC transporter permease [Paracoccaceae bacterium]
MTGLISRLTGRSSLIWLGTIVMFWTLWKFGHNVLPWAFDFPKAQTIPVAKWISSATKWLLNEATFGVFTFAEFTRFIAAVIDFPYRIVLSLLSTGFMSGPGSSATQYLPPVSWVAVIAVFALIGHHAGGRKLSVLVAVCMTLIAVFGQWSSAMVTLASILVAVPLGVV